MHNNQHPGLKWVRTCRECGHKQDASVPPTYSESYRLYAELACKGCGCRELSYGEWFALAEEEKGDDLKSPPSLREQRAARVPVKHLNWFVTGFLKDAADSMQCAPYAQEPYVSNTIALVRKHLRTGNTGPEFSDLQCTVAHEAAQVFGVHDRPD